MKNKHTEGEWKIEKSISYTFIGDHGNRVCMINNLKDGNPDHEANAKLIAAAPELLDACIESLKRLEGEHKPMAIAMLKSAIEKATK